MEKIISTPGNEALEAVTGEYAVLPSKISRHTRILNAGMRNKLRHTSFCLETQRRKFCTYHTVETAKHQTALLNLRKSLKTRPWRVDVFADSTPDAFAADISHLNPVELSRFKLMREIVANIPGEKVTMGEICDVISNIGGVYTEDKNKKAVQLRPHSRKAHARRISPKTVGFPADKEMGLTKPQNVSDTKTDTDNLSDDTTVTASEVSDGTVKAVSVVSLDTSSIVEDACSQTSGKETVSDSGIQLIEEADALETLSVTSSLRNIGSATPSAPKPKPVFITEVGYIPLKSQQKRIPKISGVRKFRSMFANNTKVKISDRSVDSHKGRKVAQPNPIRPVPEKILPVIRNTDPYGLGHSTTNVDNVKKQTTSSNKYSTGLRSGDSKSIVESSRNSFTERPSTGRKNSTVSRPGSYGRTNRTEATKTRKVKTITWKEPICSTEISFQLEKNSQKKWNAELPTETIKTPKPIMKGAKFGQLPSLNA